MSQKAFSAAGIPIKTNMVDTQDQLLKSLALLDMYSGDENPSLVFTSALRNSNSNISFYQRIALERAQRIGVDAVYFKSHSDLNRAPIAQVYIYDFSNSNDYDLAEIHKNVWSSTDVRIYFVVTKTQIKIFNSAKPVNMDDSGNYHIKPYDVLKLTGEAKEKFDLYSASKFDTGVFWNTHKNEFNYNNTAYERLIVELKNARKAFLEDIHLEKSIANKLLVLGILIKYLEERIDVDQEGNETRVFSKDFFLNEKFGYSTNLVDVIRNGHNVNNVYLINLFELLSTHFHGEIFLLPEDYKDKIRKVNLSPLANFLSGEFHNKQYVLWRLYSFNHLPIELISSIYEEFLEADRTSGVAYTPAYLVNLLVDECMPLNEPRLDFKILDPACGSGIFLVSAFKRLVDWWRVDMYNKHGVWRRPSSKELPALKELLLSSIYGVDIAQEAVSLATFSLSLTLCDLLSPTVIWEELKFDNLSANIVDNDFFAWVGENTDKKFDLVIGNPPFIEYSDKVAKISKFISGYDSDIIVPNNQSAIFFTILSAKLMKNGDGLLCLLLPAGPLLYNYSPKAEKFRKVFFETYNIPQVIDFTYLNKFLFKNKGNEKNVAVAALFIQSKPEVNEVLYHIIAKKLRTISQRHYFEFDHYDFHLVRRNEAINSRYIWKGNLLGGGRLPHLIERLAALPTLKSYIENRAVNGWVYGDGFIKGKNDALIKEKDLGKKKGGYVEAPYLTGSLTFEPNDFDEHGISSFKELKATFFQWPRNYNIFKAPLLLIKKNIGFNSIPVYLSEVDVSYKNEVIGIHCPEEYRQELENMYNRIKNNSLYRFYILATSSRSGVNRSTQTTLQSDILSLPFPDKMKDLELSHPEKVVLDDTLSYWYDFLAKDINIKILSKAGADDLLAYSNVFCMTLNTLFKNNESGYALKEIKFAESLAYIVFGYVNEFSKHEAYVDDNVDDFYLKHLLSDKVGMNHRITTIVKFYDNDDVILLKPLEKRYWLKSIAIRDADEVVKDLYKAGY